MEIGHKVNSVFYSGVLHGIVVFSQKVFVFPSLEMGISKILLCDASPCERVPPFSFDHLLAQVLAKLNLSLKLNFIRKRAKVLKRMRFELSHAIALIQPDP